MEPYRILSIDGGGVKGVYAAVLLRKLERHEPRFLEQVDLFAGTSTGGIIALGLASGKTPSDLAALYLDQADQIFADNWLDNLLDLGNLLGAQYDNHRLKQVLEDQLGPATTLDDLLPRHVLISAFDLDPGPEAVPRMWKPKFFHNYEGPQSDGDQKVVDVALRTSAAPTFFPAYQGFVDGGVVANDPSVCALAQALDRETGRQKLADIRLLSIGTGCSPRVVKGDDLDWGIGRWAWHMATLMIEGAMGVADYQCKRILGESHYHRLNPLLPEDVALDAADKVRDLAAWAEAQPVDQTLAWLGQHFL